MRKHEQIKEHVEYLNENVNVDINKYISICNILQIFLDELHEPIVLIRNNNFFFGKFKN